MDLYEILLIIVPPLCAFFGYLGKYILDKRTMYLEKINNKKLDNVESKLKNFYYPLHSNLLRENIIWEKILAFYRTKDEDILVTKIFKELDKEILKIHIENQKIIKENSIDIFIDKELSKLLIDYDEHVTIYQIIRKVDNEDIDMHNTLWPSDFGCKYPKELLYIITTKMDSLKQQQQELIYEIV